MLMMCSIVAYKCVSSENRGLEEKCLVLHERTHNSGSLHQHVHARQMFLDQKSNSLITYFRFADNEGTMNPRKIFPDEKNTQICEQNYPYTFSVNVVR